MSADETPQSGPRRRAEDDALEAEEQLDFLRAFMRLTELAATEGSTRVHDAKTAEPHGDIAAHHDGLLFRAVRDLERSEDWRLVCALWENIGDRLGDRRRGDTSVSRELFVGYSLPAEYWYDPRSDSMPERYYGPLDDTTSGARLAHAQALAYVHGAEEAAANSRFALATLLCRKAGLAWITSSWGDRTRLDDCGKWWTRQQILDVSGSKWRDAARAYFRASLFEARASTDDEKGLTFAKYRPEGTEPRCGNTEPRRWPSRPSGSPRLDLFFDANDDVKRLARCWRNWSSDPAATFAHTENRRLARLAAWKIERRAQQGLCNNLGVLEDALRAAGRRSEARGLFDLKRRAHMRAVKAGIRARLASLWVPTAPETWPSPESEGFSNGIVGRGSQAIRALLRWFGLQFERLYHVTTRTGMSIRRTLACWAILFGGVMPLVFLQWGRLRDSNCPDCAGVNYLDAARFSLGQALTVAPDTVQPSSDIGQWLAVTTTLFAAFSLGYAIWVITQDR